MSPTIMLALLVFSLSTLGAGALLAALFYPKIQSPAQLNARVAAIATPRQDERNFQSKGARKRSVEDSLRELDTKAAGQKSASLAVKLEQSGLLWSTTTFWVVSAAFGLATLGFTAFVLGLPRLPAAAFAFAAGLLLPRAYVDRKRHARFNQFALEFPNAIDVIVRGIKSGLPVIDCLKIVATETQEPVKSEFRSIVEDQTLGLSMEDAVQRLPGRMPTPEASFFAIVLAIQSKTGGSLSEALGNLSKVLRDRTKMKSKIKAMSSEAKASAYIIASMPFAVAGMVYLTSPEYISLLFTDITGNIVLVASGLWMLVGTLVMRKMINFDF